MQANLAICLEACIYYVWRSLICLVCRPTTGPSARMLATLRPPPAQAICAQTLCCLSGQGPSSALIALCQRNGPSQDVPTQPAMLVCWRVQHSITARSPGQLRSQPLVLDPVLTLAVSELGLSQQPGPGHSAEHAASYVQQSKANIFTIASMPGLRTPAIILGSSDGICCLTLPSLFLPGADPSLTSTHTVLRGVCPPSAGNSSCANTSSTSLNSMMEWLLIDLWTRTWPVRVCTTQHQG